VVARRKNQSPWYLLTSQPASAPELAWQIVLAYAHRWQIEMAIRYHKSELAFESPRRLKWNARQKLLLIAALAYAYLLSFLPLQPDSLAHWLLQHFCPRTGKRSRDVATPLYRLCLALSLFWFFHPLPSSLLYEIRDASWPRRQICRCITATPNEPIKTLDLESTPDDALFI
jgi:hypothetical protein